MIRGAATAAAEGADPVRVSIVDTALTLHAVRARLVDPSETSGDGWAAP